MTASETPGLFEPGTVVVVPFPFADVAVSRPRPALVLSTCDHQATSGCVVLAMITTARDSAWPSDVPLSDVGSTGLRTPSVVRTKIFTLDRALIDRPIGSLSDDDRKRVRQSIIGVLGL
ncbi:MAG: type II toxin-antitoxin system PemK/MazF family toxin [Alphaproteobacteria bacterium]|nr:type II toxin-antitoxin system PemK/MazF family toxin [Alphaproteobacteria bacterium]